MERLRRAINQHDLDALVACLEPDFGGEFPAHSGRGVRGHEQQRRNRAGIFTAASKTEAALMRSASDGETAWAEWEWKDARPGSASFVMRGDTVQGVRRGRISCPRLHAKPVKESGADADATVRENFAGS